MFISLALAPLLKPPAGLIFLPIFLDYCREINFESIFKKSIPFFISSLPIIIWMAYGKV